MEGLLLPFPGRAGLGGVEGKIRGFMASDCSAAPRLRALNAIRRGCPLLQYSAIFCNYCSLASPKDRLEPFSTRHTFQAAFEPCAMSKSASFIDNAAILSQIAHRASKNTK
jgi:hypothetical protein